MPERAILTTIQGPTPSNQPPTRQTVGCNRDREQRRIEAPAAFAVVRPVKEIATFRPCAVSSGRMAFPLFAAVVWRRVTPVLALLVTAIVRAETPAPLADAIKTGIENQSHWAYTETTDTWDTKGRSEGPTVFRFDPSKPYAEQFTPIKIGGKEPTEKQRKQYQKRGEDRGRRMAKRAEAQAKKGPTDPAARPKSQLPTIDLNGQKATIDIEHAQPIEETDAHYAYRIPLTGQGDHPLPVEKFELVVSVTKSTHVLESGTLRLLEPFRAKLVIKLKQGHVTMRWAVVDPKYAPVMVAEEGDLAVSLVFFSVGGSMKTERSDFKRVTPYDDRFKVDVGPLKTLTF